MLPNYDKVEGLGFLSVCIGILKIEALGTKKAPLARGGFAQTS